MKKILLSLMLIGAFASGKAQAVLNEIYFNPAAGESEYIEIYNSGAPEDLDCYTLIIKYNTGTTSGFYVINYPDNITLNSNDWSVTASSLPFTYQGGTYAGGSKDFSWNSLNTAGTGGYFKQFQRTGSTYTEIIPPVNTNDILQTLPSSDDAKYITLLYKNGILVNGLSINGGTVVPAGLTGMPDLLVPSDGTCSSFTAHFSTVQSNQLEYMIPAIGKSNGAFRTNDGRCGTWEKASSSGDNTPGATNGASGAIAGAITVEGDINCTSINGQRRITYNVVNTSTLPAAYPMVLLLYFDNGTVPLQFDADDDFIEQHTLNTVTEGNTIFQALLPGGNKGAIVIAKSTAGCFETILIVQNQCSPLPVKFSSFTANRTNASNVGISWTTASEQNSKGFNVQRNVGGVWTTIVFVPSQAVNGNSSSAFSYSYSDVNNEKGVTQYRVQQVDLDGHYAYTDIRAIRGEGSPAKVIVYPNPSADGKVNVVFEDNTIRDVQVNDMQGKVIKSYKGITNNILVIERLTSGFYTIKITNRNTAASSVEKVVVK